MSCALQSSVGSARGRQVGDLRSRANPVTPQEARAPLGGAAVHMQKKPKGWDGPERGSAHRTPVGQALPSGPRAAGMDGTPRAAPSGRGVLPACPLGTGRPRREPPPLCQPQDHRAPRRWPWDLQTGRVGLMLQRTPALPPCRPGPPCCLGPNQLGQPRRLRDSDHLAATS